MRNGFIILAISLFVAGVAWLLTGMVMTATAAGIVIFLFSLLGGLCQASDVYVDDTYGRDGNHGYASGQSEFGGRCISGSWK